MRVPRPTAIALPAAAALGLAHALSFAPWNLPALQLLALAGLFALVVRARSAGAGAALAFAFGLGWFGLGVHWVYISMHAYGEMWAPLAALATAALAAYLSVFPAAAVWAVQRVPAAPWTRLLLLLPAAWALAEWLRGWVLTGFPWLATGYAHTDGPLAGFAPLTGVAGIHLLAAFVAGVLALTTLARTAPRAALVAAVAVAAVLLAAGQALRSVVWTEAAGAPISVRLVQGNVPQDLKFTPGGLDRAVSVHERLLRGPRVDLAVLPESVFPVPVNLLPDEVTASMLDFVTRQRTALIFGVFIEEPGARYFNSALALVPDGAGAIRPPQRYSKRQLVPFGEFVPYGFRWFVDRMRMPLGDQSRGAADQAPMEVAGQRIAVNICYEDLFPEVIRASFRGPGGPPTILLNLSNLAWFDDSIALPQHLQISRMRALETGRPMLRATNTGPTAIIDARGRVVAHLPHLTAAALEGEVQGQAGSTPFLRIGSAGAVSAAGLLLAAGVLVARRQRGR